MENETETPGELSQTETVIPIADKMTLEEMEQIILEQAAESIYPETEPEITIPATIEKPVTSNRQPETKKEPKPKTRVTKSVVLSVAECEWLDEILEARKQSGKTTDWNHLIRQSLEFTVNNQIDWMFSVPNHLKSKIHLV